jgi:WD40 repeat protein
VDTQFLPRLAKGMKAWVEPSQEQPHHRAFNGHLEPITGVAVSNDSRTIVSVSDDRTARIWERGGQRELRILHHPVGLRSVACTPKGAAANYCATGGADGNIRLYDLAAGSDQPLLVFDGKHRLPVTCIAFNKDGTICATGSEDREIRIWDVATGQLKFKLTDHNGPVTSLQFTPQDQLVSAAKDNSMILWNLSAGPPIKIFPRRSDYVTTLGVSPDGKRVLFNPSESKALRVLSLPDGLYEGMIRNLSGGSGFRTLALFSPDGRFILAGEGSESRLQLWTAPTDGSRAAEIRKLALDDPSTVTCAAFAPDASFVVAGTKDRQVLAWGPLPSEKEVGIPAVISNIDRAVDQGNRPQVRIVAEFENPKGPDGVGKLMHGGTVNLVIPPAK